MSLSHGDTINVPSNAYNTFQWRAEANLHDGPFQLHYVDSCTQPLSAAGAICDIGITEVPTSDSTVDILTTNSKGPGRPICLTQRRSIHLDRALWGHQ
jgi:hypothetical protein